jgi:hypothetical protein
MIGKEITVKGKEHLKYYIAEYGEQVNICYKEGEVRWGDRGNYFIKRAVFDASYDAEKNEIDPENLAYIEPTIEEINAVIQAKREQAYKDRSDSLYMAWQKYLALGETAKAEQAKALWLEEVEKINKEFPYKS